MQRFVDAVERGQALDTELAQELAASFRAILAGEDAKHALHLLKPRGRRKDYWMTVGMARLCLVACVVEEMENGRTKSQAIELVSHEKGVPYGTLERYYNVNKVRARQWLPIMNETIRELRRLTEGADPGMNEMMTDCVAVTAAFGRADRQK